MSSFIERLKERSNQLTLGGFGRIDLIADGTVIAIDIAVIYLTHGKFLAVEGSRDDRMTMPRSCVRGMEQDTSEAGVAARHLVSKTPSIFFSSTERASIPMRSKCPVASSCQVWGKRV
jgi:hypothetical protein